MYFAETTCVKMKVNLKFHFDVLGLGETLSTYVPNESHRTIGVNDIFKHHAVDVLVVADVPARFTVERRKVIFNSTPELFLSHVDEWSVHPSFKKIKLSKGRGQLYDIDTPDVFPYSNNSTFIAVVVAYKMGAKTITLHGVDFTTHPSLCKPNIHEIVIRDFKNLFIELEKRNVGLFVSDSRSVLSGFVPVINFASRVLNE